MFYFHTPSRARHSLMFPTHFFSAQGRHLRFTFILFLHPPSATQLVNCAVSVLLPRRKTFHHHLMVFQLIDLMRLTCGLSFVSGSISLNFVTSFTTECTLTQASPKSPTRVYSKHITRDPSSSSRHSIGVGYLPTHGRPTLSFPLGSWNRLACFPLFPSPCPPANLLRSCPSFHIALLLIPTC